MTLSTTPTSKPSHLNIMADPRVFRGSVVARQREEINRCRQEIEARKAEERYRMEVVRNRLSMALSKDIPQPNPISYRRAANIRAETSARLAKLAGKTGKAAITEWAKKEHQPLILMNDEKDKVVPSIPSSSLSFERQKGGGGRHRFHLPLLSTTLTPPQSPYGPIYHNDASVQTDEGFEEAFCPIISEMAATAISDALKNLKDEEDFRIMEEQNEKLLNIVVSEKRRNSELNLSILKHIRTEHEIAREREMAWHQLKAIDSHQMATQIISTLIEKCTENLADHGLIE
uniref:Uncharacterized protein n=1 Tax=Panagrolaimus sp. ES5 TaxID=591445 RepID=A0AC34G650_9BILA